MMPTLTPFLTLRPQALRVDVVQSHFIFTFSLLLLPLLAGQARQ